MSCRDVRDWLHREVESLDETQRLVLDDHLAACESCRGDRERMRLLHEVGTSLPIPPAGAREYNRAIARALLEGKRTPVARPARWFVPAVAFAAVAAAAVVVIVIATRGDEPTHETTAGETIAPSPTPMPTPTPTPTPDRSGSLTPTLTLTPLPEVGDVVVEGEIINGERVLGRGAAIPANVTLKAVKTATLRLVAQRVVVAASSELRWVPRTKLLVVERGSIELDPQAPSELRVDVKHRAPSKKTAAELLAEARTQFVAKDYAAAETTAGRALEAKPTHGEAAEIHMLLADVAQGAGKLDLAVERYTAVASDFAGSAAAESALYAAARIELRRHDAMAARALLTRYLDRHPMGRYADDVRRELDGLH